MSWIYLIVAIISEVFGTITMKLSEGFSKIGPSVMIFVFYAVSLTFLTLALRKIEIGIAYAVWSGLGTALIAILGIFIFKESLSLLKMISIFLIILGVIGLNLAGGEEKEMVQVNVKEVTD